MPSINDVHLQCPSSGWPFGHVMNSPKFLSELFIHPTRLLAEHSPVPTLKEGDPITVMPWETAGDSEVLAIAEVKYVGPLLLRLMDGREYFTSDGKGLNSQNCVVAATIAHLKAVADRWVEIGHALPSEDRR